MLPNFIGIGAARGGTTWLAQNLGQHPQIFMSPKKEVHFFDRYYENGITYYEEEFREWKGEKAIGEITPQYLHNEVVAQRINATLPDVKLIVCLRNPIERAYSHYWKSKASFSDPTNASFEEKLEKLPEILQVGFYYDHLLRYYKLFPKESIHIILHDDIEKRPLDIVSQVYRFLDVAEGFQSPLLYNEINVGASQGNLAKSRLFWYLQRGLTYAGFYKLARKVEKMNRTSLPAMKSETRARLSEQYREQTLKLQDLINHDLTHWLT